MSRFENLRMFEYESFDEFYLRLATIVNQAAGIGHVFDSTTIVRKIFRVLPRAKYGSRIDSIIENVGNLSRLTVNELVGKLRSDDAFYENIQTPDPKKEKRIAFSSRAEEEYDCGQLDMNTDNLEVVDQNIALLSQKIKKMLIMKNKLNTRYGKPSNGTPSYRGNPNNRPRNSMNSSPSLRSKPEGSIGPCFRCNEMDHLEKDCPTKEETRRQHSNFSVD